MVSVAPVAKAVLPIAPGERWCKLCCRSIKLGCPALSVQSIWSRISQATGRCRACLHAPTAHNGIGEWCQALGISRRNFTRVFRQETGLSFVAWRQQACLVVALPRLAACGSVTTIAMALGYDNPNAFTSMFKLLLGASPRDYLAGNDHRATAGAYLLIRHTTYADCQDAP